ncbi:MAG: response regulator [Elusimicrobiota bacterium]
MGQPKKIVLLDDDEDILALLELSLQSAGYNPILCYNPTALVDLAAREQPSLIVLDIVMPQMDGFTLNKKLKENPATKDIPVIIASGKGKMAGLFKLTPGSNIAGFLEKPFTSDMLISKVREVIG